MRYLCVGSPEMHKCVLFWSIMTTIIYQSIEVSIETFQTVDLHSCRYCGGSVSEGRGFASTSKGLCNRHDYLKLNNEENATGGANRLYCCLGFFR